MLVVLVMCMRFPSRAHEVAGKQCPGIGDKTGRAIHISMVKASLLLSQPAMDAVWFHTMLPRPVGPLDRLILEGSIAIETSLILLSTVYTMSTEVWQGYVSKIL